MEINPPVGENVADLLRDEGFKQTSTKGLWVRENGERSEFVDFEKGSPGMYAYFQDEDKSAGISPDMERIRKRIRAEHKKDSGGQKTLDELQDFGGGQ